MDEQKKIPLTPTIAITIALIVIGGIVYANYRPKGDLMMKKGSDMIEEGDAMIEEGSTMMEEGDSMMKEGEGMMEGGSAMMEYAGGKIAGTESPLLEFNKKDYDAAVSSGKLVVLYFYANWCPTCKAEFPIVMSVFDSLTDQNVIGFRVNYNDSDTSADEVALAKKFGVAYQHTKVFVKNNERVLKSPESWDAARYQMEIEKYAK